MNKLIKSVTNIQTNLFYDYELNYGNFIYIKYDKSIFSRHIGNNKYGINLLKYPNE